MEPELGKIKLTHLNSNVHGSEANYVAAKENRFITLSQSYTWSGRITFTRCV